MSELQEKLLEIKRQKDTYIIPENLKKNITVLGVTGTLEPGSGGVDVKLFETIAGMQADPNPQEGDLAIVYREEIQSITEESEFDSCIFPNEVVLDEAFTGSIYGDFRSPGSGDFDGMVGVSSSSFIFASYGEDSSNIRVEYTSSDGITYTRTDGGEELHEFGLTLKWSSEEAPWNDVIGNFIKISGMVFEGLYEYKTNQYVIADSQLTLSSSNQLLSGITGYGKNGITVGNLGTTVSTAFNDVSAEIYTKTQIVYNDMTPLVASNNNKRAGLSDDIVLVPCKSDGIPLLDTSNVTNMYNMFRDCSNLTLIPLLDTSNVTNMVSMFHGCSNLTSIPLLDTSNVADMASMFNSCSSLTTIPLLNTSNVTNMGSMFSWCTSLTTIPLLDTSNVTNMYNMFRDCSNLTSIPLLDTSNVTNMDSMFYDCSSLTTIPLLDTSNVTNMQHMFNACSSLTTIPLLNTSNVTSMVSMFSSCSNLTSIPLLDTSNVTNMRNMFYGCSSLNNESLNNILAMCTNAAKITSNKTLKYIRLTEEQATICRTLSNYSAFTSAGWTTGY